MGYEPANMRRYIFGAHVSDYMEELEEEEPDSFRRHFSRFIKHSIKHDDLEQIYKTVHKEIRANPIKSTKSTRKKPQLQNHKRTKIESLKRKLISLEINKQC